MYHKLTSEFTIGKYRFRGCVNCEISKSVLEYQDKGIITLPTSAVVKRDGTVINSVQTAKAFTVGDPVLIRLGYDGNLQDEFKGFVSRVNLTTPCEIELEGYSYLLRTKKNIVAEWKSTTLKEVLEKIVEGTDITLHPDIPDVPINNLKIDNANGIQVIDYVKGLFKGSLTVCFFDNVIYAGLAYMDTAKTTVKYQLGWNTINADNLKAHSADEVEVNVQLQFRKGSGEQIVVESGKKGGIVKKDTISAVTDMAALKEIANAKLRQESYDGYEGDFSAFLLPFVQHGYRADLSDQAFPDRGGSYFVESVKTKFGSGGGRHIVQVGIKLA